MNDRLTDSVTFKSEDLFSKISHKYYCWKGPVHTLSNTSKKIGLPATLNGPHPRKYYIMLEFPIFFGRINKVEY